MLAGGIHCMLKGQGQKEDAWEETVGLLCRELVVRQHTWTVRTCPSHQL